MIKTVLRLFFISLLFSIKTIHSQIDVPGQFYYNEILLNPSLTGLVENKWRLKNTHRLQINENNHLQKNCLWFDYKIVFTRKTGEYGLKVTEYMGYMMGIGVYDLRVKNSFESKGWHADYLSIAFHKMLSKKKDYLSLGIQPGYIRKFDEKFFDFNFGLMFGSGSIFCWQEDQYFKTQIGVAFYNILSSKKNTDSIYFAERQFKFHFGQLINKFKHYNIFASGCVWKDSKTNFSIGAVVLFFPVVHYRFYDRGRIGIHYRNSNHIVVSAGCRFYGQGQKSLSLDGMISYDLPMSFLDIKSKYRHGFEIGILLTPLVKCWSLSRC